MKKHYTTASLVLLFSALSSFNSRPQTSGFENTGTTTARAIFPVCNGDYIELEVKDDFVMRGTSNNNRANVRIKHHLTGKGVSLYSGETYTIDTEIESTGNVPVSRGAMVLRDIISDDMQGDQGSMQSVVFRSHLTFNAAGKLTADHFDAAVNCR